MLLAVIAGLFAMHGLGMHGVHSAEAASATHSGPSDSSAPGQEMGATERGPDGGSPAPDAAKAGRAGFESKDHDSKMAGTPSVQPEPSQGRVSSKCA